MNAKIPLYDSVFSQLLNFFAPGEISKIQAFWPFAGDPVSGF
jgi:hypothetical protein